MKLGVVSLSIVNFKAVLKLNGSKFSTYAEAEKAMESLAYTDLPETDPECAATIEAYKHQIRTEFQWFNSMEDLAEELNDNDFFSLLNNSAFFAVDWDDNTTCNKETS